MHTKTIILIAEGSFDRQTLRCMAAAADRQTSCCQAEASLILPIDLQGAELPDEIQWMPPGEHDITPFVEGKARRFKMTITPELADRFNRQLQTLRGMARNGECEEPYLDIMHKDEVRIADVTQFYWGGSDPKSGGIRARVSWTAAGRDAVKGRNYRRFSPQWELFEDDLSPSHITENLGGLPRGPHSVNPHQSPQGTAALNLNPQQTKWN